MKLKVSRKGFLALTGNLSNADSSERHFIAKNTRHPFDILKLALDGFYRAQKELIDSEKIHAIDPDRRKSKAISDYFLELDRFYDASLLVMKAMSPASDYDNQNVEVWLKKERSGEYTRYKDSVSASHKIIRKIANKLKHDSIELRYIHIVSHNDKTINGFYFSQIVGENSLVGPDTDIHKDYKGTKTAMSYNYSIMYGIGFISLCMASLNKIIFSNSNVEESTHGIESVFSAIMNCSEIKMDFFPNEYSQPTSVVTKSGDFVTVEFPKRIRASKHVDRIRDSKPLFLFNQRTSTANDQYPYYHLIS
ncbi:TPA: hypothetical protein ACMD0O_004593 [Vibrio parahaemolyticus]|nr:hypothetical protein [Vibrio parahaemolyticus]